MNKETALTVESDEEGDDTELLVDWRGKIIRTASSSKSRNAKKKNGTEIPAQGAVQIDEGSRRRISFEGDARPMVENTPEVSVSGRGKGDPAAAAAAAAGTNLEMQFGKGSTPSVVLETPITAQLDVSVVKATPFTGELGSKGLDLADSAARFGDDRLLIKCSGGADVICLDSDNESDGCVDGIIKKEKLRFNASAPHTVAECPEIAYPIGDAVYSHGNHLSSKEHNKKDQSPAGDAIFCDDDTRKVTVESISETSAFDFTEEIALCETERIVKDAEDVISRVFHLLDNERGSRSKSIGTSSELKEIDNMCKEVIGSTDFSLLEVTPEENIGGLRKRELNDDAVKSSVRVFQTNSVEKPSSDVLDCPRYKDNDSRNCIIGNMEVVKDHALHDNFKKGGAEQQALGRKGRKPRKEGKEQNKDLASKEAGGKRQPKDRENIKRDREEEKKRRQEEIARSKQEKEEEKQRQREEKRRKREEEKVKKASSKAEAAEIKKRQKEKEKWEKGKFALQSITAYIDTKVVERGLLGGHLLHRLAEKDLRFHLISSQVQSSITWKMNMPDEDAQMSLKDFDIPYILLVLEAEEFCNMVSEGCLKNHVYNVQGLYPGYTVCYLVNKLMAYLIKRDQEQYKNQENGSCWRRPLVEQALAKFVTHFVGVHSRLCLDEAEVADHIVGLTRSLAECLFRRKLTYLSMSANGSHIPKDYPNKDIIKKSVWMKALVAIPKVTPKCALAIAKKYPTMRSLLNVYLDPGRTVHEKEFLLQDLVTEGLLGEGGRRLGPVCSKRVYRILMSQSGSLKTDDVEEGADLFQA